MADTILITGGAGFIGSHIADALIERGYPVIVYDNLAEQVHGPGAARPAYLHPDAEFIQGDVRDYEALARALKRATVVFHKAAAVGVGQSMYEVRHYVETNTMGAANLLHFVANESHTIRKLIVASSMSCYGEGLYDCPSCGKVNPQLRTLDQLRRHDWEMYCPRCDGPAAPCPTPESKPLQPTSIYAVTKRDHEEMFLAIGAAYQISAIALRYFNVYGPRQALNNPYTGVGAIFSSRLLNNNSPIIYEDGGQSRDFVHVTDVARANVLALESGPEADGEVFNIGTGRATSILKMASRLREFLGKDGIPFDLPMKFRAGDIRHCFADISRAKKVLGFQPSISIETGVSDLVEWVKRQQATDLVLKAASELERKRLLY